MLRGGLLSLMGGEIGGGNTKMVWVIAIIIVAITSTNICLAGEEWTYDFVFHQYELNSLPQNLRSYALVEGDLPPMRVDEDVLIDWWTRRRNVTPTQEEVDRFKADLSRSIPEMGVFTRVTGQAHNCRNHFGGEYLFDEPLAADGFQQAWGYLHGNIDFDPLDRSDWTTGMCSYEFARFKTRDEALEWFDICTNGTDQWMQYAKNNPMFSGYPLALHEYSIGDKAIAMRAGVSKQLWMVAGDIGVYIYVPILPCFQTDEMLPEKLAQTIEAKIGIPEKGIILCLVFISMFLLAQERENPK